MLDPNSYRLEAFKPDPRQHAAEESLKVDGLANGASRHMAWSAEEVPAGHYYFVVVVDPENAHGAYRLFRSEFSILCHAPR